MQAILNGNQFRKLLEKGKLPDALREECRLDANMYVRKLVAEQEN